MKDTDFTSTSLPDSPTLEFAESQGLRYVCDKEPGIRRIKVGKGFVYRDHQGRKVTNEKLLSRIRSLVIPPAWADVWICRYQDGHLQVTGRDARGRKQYRYHADWSQSRNQDKFARMLRFGQILPKVRARIEEDLKKPFLSRPQVLAAVVQTMERTRLRVGNDIYSRENNSYGLTTVRNHHVTVKGRKVHFYFRGKSGVMRDVKFTDARLSRIIRNCQELPGEELFGYKDETGKIRDIGSQDVNVYLKEISGEDISAKDFRTWGGTIRAVELLLEMGKCEETTKVARKRRELEVIKNVSKYLGNTVAVCRKYYVSPKVFEADASGYLHRGNRKACSTDTKGADYSECEKLLLKVLKKDFPTAESK